MSYEGPKSAPKHLSLNTKLFITQSRRVGSRRPIQLFKGITVEEFKNEKIII